MIIPELQDHEMMERDEVDGRGGRGNIHGNIVVDTIESLYDGTYGTRSSSPTFVMNGGIRYREFHARDRLITQVKGTLMYQLDSMSTPQSGEYMATGTFPYEIIQLRIRPLTSTNVQALIQIENNTQQINNKTIKLYYPSEKVLQITKIL